MVEAALTYVLVIGGLVYGAACLAAFAGSCRRHAPRASTLPAVSVIVPARNEESSIEGLLDDLRNQDYPRGLMEMVVVDDCSEDATEAIIARAASEDPRIRAGTTRHSAVPFRFKKRALQEGIAASRGDLIMTLDADCRIGRSWVRKKAAAFTPGLDLVAGEVLIEGGGLLGALETLEMAGIQAMSAGLMNIGFPITCNGANLAYRRTAFERVGGFSDIGHMVSGDDDLLMQKIAMPDPRRVWYQAGRETAVVTRAVRNLPEFLERRTRWASKITGYPSLPALGVLIVFFFYFLAIPTWLAGMAFAGWSLWPVLLGFGIKTAGDALLVFRGLLSMGRLPLALLFPVAEMLHIPYVMVVTLRGVFGTFRWRGQLASSRQPG